MQMTITYFWLSTSHSTFKGHLKTYLISLYFIAHRYLLLTLALQIQLPDLARLINFYIIIILLS